MIGHRDMWSGIKNSEKKESFRGYLILVKVSKVRIKLFWVKVILNKKWITQGIAPDKILLFCDHLNGTIDVSYLELLLFFTFYMCFGINLLQNKDMEVDSIQKFCLIQPAFKNFVAKSFLKKFLKIWLLLFSRKYN